MRKRRREGAEELCVGGGVVELGGKAVQPVSKQRGCLGLDAVKAWVQWGQSGSKRSLLLLFLLLPLCSSGETSCATDFVGDGSITRNFRRHNIAAAVAVAVASVKTKFGDVCRRCDDVCQSRERAQRPFSGRRNVRQRFQWCKHFAHFCCCTYADALAVWYFRWCE